MKKRAKLIGTLTAFCASLCMMIVGVLSASQVGLNVTSSVSFEASGVYVKVKGEVLKGNDTTEPTRAEEPEGSDYYYIGYSYDAVDEEQETDTQTTDYNDAPVGTSSNGTMTAWTIGNVEFSEEENIIRYSLTFTNYSEKDIQATITTNKDTFLQDTDVQGKVNIEETSSSLTIGGYNGETAQTGTYTITMKLTNFSSSFTNKSLTIDVNFEVFVPPTINYDYFTYSSDHTAVTGLSDTYKNLEEKPETLVVPSMYFDGTPITAIKTMDSNSNFVGVINNHNIIRLPEKPSIPNSGFTDLAPSSNIIIQNGIITIDSYAFYSCKDLTSINIAESVKSIGGSAFYNCNSLSSINIPKGVTSIGDYTFYNCSSLSSITIPDGATSIGDYAFYNCSSLSSINIPDGVTSIGEHAFYNCSSLLSSITIPDGVKSIGNYTFYNCSSLSSITILDGVKSIGNGAFNGCSGLSSVSFGSNSQLTSIGYKAFYQCSSLSSINIPEGVTEIGSSAFRDCSSLSSINIPEGVTEIGSSAFSSCTSLSSITIPSTVSSIGTLAFDSCYALVEIYNYSSLTLDGSSSVGDLGQYALKIHNLKVGDEKPASKISGNGNVQYYDDGTDIIAIGTYGNRNTINEITFKDSTTKINKYAFYECYALTSLTLPSSVKEIGSSAFNYCYALAEVYNYTGLNVSSYFSYEKVIHTTDEQTKIIKEYGMQYYKNDDGTYIALSPIDRSSIKEVNIKAGTTEINEYAFYKCYALTSVSLPNSVTSIGSSAFSSCSNLTSVTLPNSGISIGSSAFSSCSSLTNIILPSSVTSIGEYAFYKCSNLSSVTFGENSQLTSIGEYAFSYCSNLSSISLPEGVKSIGNRAFYHCRNLSSINIPEGVIRIDVYAFYGCSGLINIDMTNVVDWNNLTLGIESFCTDASTKTPTVITVASGQIRTAKTKLTSSVIGSSMTNKIKLTNGSTTYVWNGSAWK